MKNSLKCYIYTRVSTKMQTEGYSLDAQREAAETYAKAYNMQIIREYSDEGKSGKNVIGRPEFTQMLNDVSTMKDKVDYVLVFKLSRFGRNAADVLSSLQLLEDYGVHLICVEDGIDSSKDAGKLLISVLSAVAEIERDNIRAQTMAGREQKAREGKWNGGFAPYGYKLVDGKLEIEEEEAKAIRAMFEMYTTTLYGGEKIAQYLNDHYEKKIRQNGSLSSFTARFVIKALDNPVYIGKIAYGRRKTTKVEGKHNEFKVVRQEDYNVYEGIHEPIISQEVWDKAQEKRQSTGGINLKTHSLDHEHLLSGILKCPVCGKGMYGNVNRKKHPNGGYYTDNFYYGCKHREHVDGHPCNYHRQWNQKTIDGAVEEVIFKIVSNPKFTEELRKQVNSKTDLSEIDADIELTNKKIRKIKFAKDRVNQQIDTLDFEDPMYEEKYEDMQNRVDNLYSDLRDAQADLEALLQKRKSLETNQLTAQNIFTILLNFNKLYAKLTDKDKKLFIKSFVEEVQIFKEKQKDGKVIRNIKFKFPIPYKGNEVQEIGWDNEKHVETVVLLNRESKS